MRKKIVLILIAVLLAGLLASCEKGYVPDPAVEEYLNSGLTAQKAFDKLSCVSYTTVMTVLNKNGDELGRQESKVEFDVSDKKALTLSMTNIYSGSLVSEGVTEQVITLKRDGDKYSYETVTNVQSKNGVKELEDQVALDIVTALVYVDNGAYDSSGLYYGDIFMLKIYRFPAKSFYVDEKSDLCVFDEKMLIVRDDETGDVKLYQTTKINRLGLLVSTYEKYESVNKDYVMVNEVNADYVYVESAN